MNMESYLTRVCGSTSGLLTIFARIRPEPKIYDHN